MQNPNAALPHCRTAAHKCNNSSRLQVERHGVSLGSSLSHSSHLYFVKNVKYSKASRLLRHPTFYFAPRNIKCRTKKLWLWKHW